MDVKAIANIQTSVQMNSQNVEVQNTKVSGQNENTLSQNQKFDEKNKLTADLVEKIIEDLKKKLSMLNTQLQIQIDKDTDTIVVKVIDKETNKVIRQIPPEYVLKIAKYLDEIAGILYNEKV